MQGKQGNRPAECVHALTGGKTLHGANSRAAAGPVARIGSSQVPTQDLKRKASEEAEAASGQPQKVPRLTVKLPHSLPSTTDPASAKVSMHASSAVSTQHLAGLSRIIARLMVHRCQTV